MEELTHCTKLDGRSDASQNPGATLSSSTSGCTQAPSGARPRPARMRSDTGTTSVCTREICADASGLGGCMRGSKWTRRSRAAGGCAGASPPGIVTSAARVVFALALASPRCFLRFLRFFRRRRLPPPPPSASGDASLLWSAPLPPTTTTCAAAPSARGVPGLVPPSVRHLPLLCRLGPSSGPEPVAGSPPWPAPSPLEPPWAGVRSPRSPACASASLMESRERLGGRFIMRGDDCLRSSLWS